VFISFAISLSVEELFFSFFLFDCRFVMITLRSDMSEKAADREKDNPKCGVCGIYPTNHFCSFVSAEGIQCSKPVCAICKGESGPTRCFDHLWSEKIWNNVSVPSTVAGKQASGPIGNKNAGRKIVAKRIQQICSECNKNSTPSTCVECKVPVCTSCKLKFNGILGSHCCKLHAKKIESTVVVNRADELQPEIENSELQVEQLTNNNDSKTLLSPAGQNKRKHKSTKGSSAIVENETDSLLHKTVAYNIDSSVGKKICSQLPCSISSSSLRENCIVGTVTRKLSTRLPSGKLVYEVSWNNSAYGVLSMSHTAIVSGIENFLELEHQTQQSQLSQQVQFFREMRRLDPYDNQDIMKLIEKSRKEDPELSPCSSGSESDGTEDSDLSLGDAFFGETHIDRTKAMEPYAQDNEYLLVSDEEDNSNELALTNVDELDGLDWDPRETLQPRPAKMTPKPSSTKDQYVTKFDTPISSFFSFLPQTMWEKIRFESNKYARQKMLKSGEQRIAGWRWRHDITIEEMYQFFGLLIYMATLPAPGRDYTYYWEKFYIYTWTNCMRLYRFKQIRSVLHFNSSTRSEKSKDPLHTVRPIYATIQETLGRYLDLGSEFSLDEASAACRSSFGRHLIVYNPTKNCGKFHFRFYLLCCSTSYVCIKMRIHVKTDEMVEEDAFQGGGDEAILSSASTKVLNRLILDMARPLYGKGMTINFNNYYASPAVAIELLKHEVYCRGTLRKNKRLIPPYILFKKSEARNKESRGETKIAVNKKYGLVAVGWIDGNPVHMISSADTEKLTTVQRQIGGKKEQYKPLR